MNKPMNKKSTTIGIQICLDCWMPDCIPTSIDCPLFGKTSEEEKKKREKALALIKERGKNRKTQEEIKAEIKRVKLMMTKTNSYVNKFRAKKEIARLKELSAVFQQRKKSLTNKAIAELTELSLTTINSIDRRMARL